MARKIWLVFVRLMTLALVFTTTQCIACASFTASSIEQRTMITKSDEVVAAVVNFISRDPTRVVIFDPEWSPDEIGVMTHSLKKWEIATKNQVKFAMSADFESYKLKQLIVLKRNSRDDIVKNVEERFNLTSVHPLGWGFEGSTESFIIIVVDRIDELSLLEQVMTHEVGHILGLQHIDMLGSSVMYPAVSGMTTCPTIFDIQQFCQLYSCDIKDMNPCAFLQSNQ